jgi:hypothetical protein
MSEYDQETSAYSRPPDLEKLAKEAPSRRELAWELLKQTRNATYVAMRYGYDIETMEKALSKIPEDESLHRKLNPRGYGPPPLLDRGKPKQASEALPESYRREPGSDDDLGE